MRRMIVMSCLLLVGASCSYYRTALNSGPGCQWESTRCRLSSDCCSMWCVNGFCERREP
jgi:hypothetical protein